MNNEPEVAFDPLTVEMLSMLNAFRDLAVPHIVVGGFAVRVHGHLRAVGDLDLLVDTSGDSLTRLYEALGRLGIEGAAEITALFGRSAKAKWRWRDGHEDHYVDLLTQVDEYRFGAAAEDVFLVRLGALLLSVLSRRKLIATKRVAAANPKRGEKAAQDMEDLEALSVDSSGDSVDSRRYATNCSRTT
jgi:hypothetical protein